MRVATGVVRQVDLLGRIVVPISIRRQRDIEAQDAVEIYVDGDSVILMKYSPGCVFCGDCEGLSSFKGERVCHNCAAAIGEVAVAAE